VTTMIVAVLTLFDLKIFKGMSINVDSRPSCVEMKDVGRRSIDEIKEFTKEISASSESPNAMIVERSKQVKMK
jgi:hypothetical protein